MLRQLPAVQVISILILFQDTAGQGLLDQCAARHAEQLGCIQIRLLDQTLFADGAISDRRQVIQVEVTFPRCVKRGFRHAQFIVLHLQFDLMDAQLVHQMPRFFR